MCCNSSQLGWRQLITSSFGMDSSSIDFFPPMFFFPLIKEINYSDIFKFYAKITPIKQVDEGFPALTIMLHFIFLWNTSASLKISGDFRESRKLQKIWPQVSCARSWVFGNKIKSNSVPIPPPPTPRWYCLTPNKKVNDSQENKNMHNF